MNQEALETTTLGGGCFWCLEAIFRRLPGVKKVTSGYAGGHLDSPDYKQVCSGETGHAEVVQIEFDPTELPFEALLDMFWKAHDPTTLNRQGGDVGTQYRSVIYFHDEAQAETARASLAALEASGAYPNPPVTEIEPLDTFWPAEDYHKDYFELNPNASYCAFNIAPKIGKLGLG